jgi:hypothetical protein
MHTQVHARMTDSVVAGGVRVRAGKGEKRRRKVAGWGRSRAPRLFGAALSLSLSLLLSSFSPRVVVHHLLSQIIGHSSNRTQHALVFLIIKPSATVARLKPGPGHGRRPRRAAHRGPAPQDALDLSFRHAHHRSEGHGGGVGRAAGVRKGRQLLTASPGRGRAAGQSITGLGGDVGRAGQQASLGRTV